VQNVLRNTANSAAQCYYIYLTDEEFRHTRVPSHLEREECKTERSNFKTFLVGQRPYGKQSSLETSATVGTAVRTFDHTFYDPKEFTSLDFLIRASILQNTFLICQVFCLGCRHTYNNEIKHETQHGINQAKLNFVVH
jgi:hypothetical protein